MKKFLTAAIAATIAVSSMGVASAAEAQSRGGYDQRQDHRGDRADRRDDRRDDRGDRRDRREDRRDDRRDHRNDRREFRQDQREDRREYRQDQRAYARWQQSQRRYNAGRYYAPRGYQTRSWSYGQRMPSYYRSNQYVVSNYGQYGLRAPPRGYHYVRSGNDVVLAAVAGGLITAVIAGLFN
ncbi:MAG: RcnB family protein [Alphaproteobacteria bacterium]|jgi:Ni/Co efflux regulator RcnB|nr:RcnB family protein [Alphaproteobacteria bacterium]MBU2042487.1 RcnB family protein [Alphaproteobacteria bacterium]MBU2126285.1 RcnB family protein [Alphaproteobacteria bacterium]MBU2207341.1 RcnB family protein [Alphaproteobacteria bacterium]MBU2292419.1 RcnB family protein [Alphaproteobacteria bacterium]